MNAPATVSIVATFHREGLLAHRSLLSMQRCREAALAAGYQVQWVLTLDRADAETTRVVTEFAGLQAQDVVAAIDVGDLGLSRNHAVGLAGGEWIGICDGDDYLSRNWIAASLDALRPAPETSIAHPELIVHFDGEQALSRQLAQRDPDFDPAMMLMVNPWNSCSFALRRIYLDCPYLLSRPGETGFGFEDWHWNCETLARGLEHVIAAQTVHYVRLKRSGSLNRAHAAARALIHPTALFDPGAQQR